MKVLILDRSIGNGYSLGLASGLRAAGAQVALAGSARSGAADVHPVYPRAGVAGQRPRKALDLAFGALRLAVLLWRFRPDVVHAQWAASIDLAYVRFARAVSGGPVVYTAHNPIARLGEDLSRQGEVLALAADVVVHSDSLGEALRRSYPQLRADVHSIPLGNYEHVIERFGRESARDELGLNRTIPVFAFVGQIRPYKGVETLLEAFALHAERGLPGQLVVAGATSDRRYTASLKERAAQLGVEVVWLVAPDRIPQRTLDLVASAATQIVLPFHEGTQSASTIFALTHGRCVVTTAVGVVAETVGDRGIVVPPRNPELLAEALSVAVKQPLECDRLGADARAFVLRELSWNLIGERTLAVYTRALARRARAHVSFGGTA